ncbi:DUF1835 domain-containing protein [Trinickia terrae]|uniref:DUF1835 domain-containing protein n=1 Tax=Trinickia terrae TaxID=2571161 RepID=A0A4U1HDS4_9BURK|nr:DUF1835 domain-containing protein [Trinickia terrae]TKC79051.1 DUF1835 domain-containing protein [Trinickia terrae]
MSPIHVIPGGSAAEALRVALLHAGRNDEVVELRDDLAIGPLRGADDMPDVRKAFWARVFDETSVDIDFAQELQGEAARIERIVAAEAQLVVWHAQSAADQLMLRRVAYHLRDAPQRLNEVRLSVDDLGPRALETARSDRATAAGMFSPEILAAKLLDAAPISVLRIGRLALEWQEVKQANAETRRWQDNTFKSGSFAELDAILVQRASDGWQAAARVAGELMAADVGFLVSDSIALWRCREAAAAGRIELRGASPHGADWRTLELRAAVAACHSTAPQ